MFIRNNYIMLRNSYILYNVPVTCYVTDSVMLRNICNVAAVGFVITV